MRSSYLQRALLMGYKICCPAGFISSISMTVESYLSPSCYLIPFAQWGYFRVNGDSTAMSQNGDSKTEANM
jgi:hypothetical protein